MTTYSEIPTQPGGPFSEQVTINGVTYTLRFAWNIPNNCWIMDIWDSGNVTEILCGVPVVTGCDLLEQFLYLPPGDQAILEVMSIGPAVSPDTVPTFTNFGIDGRLFMLTP